MDSAPAQKDIMGTSSCLDAEGFFVGNFGGSNAHNGYKCKILASLQEVNLSGVRLPMLQVYRCQAVQQL